MSCCCLRRARNWRATLTTACSIARNCFRRSRSCAMSSLSCAGEHAVIGTVEDLEGLEDTGFVAVVAERRPALTEAVCSAPRDLREGSWNESTCRASGDG